MRDPEMQKALDLARKILADLPEGGIEPSAVGFALATAALVFHDSVGIPRHIFLETMAQLSKDFKQIPVPRDGLTH